MLFTKLVDYGEVRIDPSDPWIPATKFEYDLNSEGQVLTKRLLTAQSDGTFNTLVTENFTYLD